jgi:hypothetical protein
MTAPAWLADALAGVMIATAAYCLGRIAAARRARRRTSYDVDGIHILMGMAMAGMLAPRLNPLAGSGWARDGWEVLFGSAAAWFAWQVARGHRHQAAAAVSGRAAHQLQHVLACGAMLYMFVAVVPATAGSQAAGMAIGGPASNGIPGTGAGIPALAFGLALGLLGYAIWATDRLVSLARGPGTQVAVTGGPATAPMSARLSACCDIVMGVTMGYMLITML